MGIQHFEDLRVDDLARVLSSDWEITEKFDGSFIKAGLDESGRFYTQRKGDESFYHADEWPALAWANAFRQVHDVLEIYFEEYLKDRAQPGDWVGCEIINGNAPNTLFYIKPNNIVITTTSVGLAAFFTELDTYNGAYEHENKFLITLNQDELLSQAGWSFTTVRSYRTWTISRTPIVEFDLRNGHYHAHYEPTYKAYITASHIKTFLNRQSAIRQLSNQELLNVKLNKRLDFIPADMWSEYKVAIKRWREEAQETLDQLVNELKILLMDQFQNRSVSQLGGLIAEGIVVRTSDDILFKIVDREPFHEANHFTHLVRYWLIGGRRPAKPCFLSRTKDWPMDKRLKRLERLRLRYIKYRTKLFKGVTMNSKYLRLTYTGDLHQRTLNLFADTRERIINGR